MPFPGLKYLFSILFIVLIIRSDAQISVTTGLNAAALARKLAGKGVIIANPRLKCFSAASGSFTVTSSNLGLDSGIVLTTGRAATIPGFYGVDGPASALANNDIGGPGDSSLNLLAGQVTHDACALEFDVTPQGDSISIGYVFSSEEYISAVCGPYNDVFAFFISGPGITGTKNIALVPGTNIPVTINSINNGTPGSSGDIANCTAMGLGSPFTAYYRDNAAGTTLTHQGMTSVLRAAYPVVSCGTYHLKIVIADAGNGKYDSGVFLEAGSLQSSSYSVLAVPIPVRDTVAPVCVKGCLPGAFKIKRDKVTSADQVIRFVTGGSAVSGVDYAPIADSVLIPGSAAEAAVVITGLPTALTGIKTLTLYIMSPDACGSATVVDSATMLIYDSLNLAYSHLDTAICNGDTLVLNAGGDSIYAWKWSPEADISGGGQQYPSAWPRKTTTYFVSASLPGTACPVKMAAVTVKVKATPGIIIANPDTTVCYDASFTLAPLIFPANTSYRYQWNGPAGYFAVAATASVQQARAKDAGLYTLKVTNDTNGCSKIGSVAVLVDIPVSPMNSSPGIICTGTRPQELLAEGDQLKWFVAGSTSPFSSPPVIPTDHLAQYAYMVTQRVGQCESPPTHISVEVKQCCAGSPEIPNAFTPNNDGHNDQFRVQESYGYYLKKLTIYDRWGVVIHNSNTGVWDGNFGGVPADAGTYFYKIVLGCIMGGTLEQSGDLTLIR